MSLSRRILATLASDGPMTGVELASELEANYPTVANVCSMMVRDGSLTELGQHRGRKYKASARMPRADLEQLREMVEAFGVNTVRAALRDLARSSS